MCAGKLFVWLPIQKPAGQTRGHSWEWNHKPKPWNPWSGRINLHLCSRKRGWLQGKSCELRGLRWTLPASSTQTQTLPSTPGWGPRRAWRAPGDRCRKRWDEGVNGLLLVVEELASTCPHACPGAPEIEIRGTPSAGDQFDQRKMQLLRHSLHACHAPVLQLALVGIE